MEKKIRFLRDAQVKQGDGKGERFKAGAVVSMSEPSAHHWISRGMAVEVTEKYVRDIVEERVAARLEAENKAAEAKAAEDAKAAADKKTQAARQSAPEKASGNKA